MSFCLKAVVQLFVFWLLPYPIKQPKSQQNNVLQVGRAKSMTEKITEGHGSGEQLPKMREHGRFLGAAWD